MSHILTHVSLTIEIIRRESNSRVANNSEFESQESVRMDVSDPPKLELTEGTATMKVDGRPWTEMQNKHKKITQNARFQSEKQAYLSWLDSAFSGRATRDGLIAKTRKIRRKFRQEEMVSV